MTIKIGVMKIREVVRKTEWYFYTFSIYCIYEIFELSMDFKVLPRNN